MHDVIEFCVPFTLAMVFCSFSEVIAITFEGSRTGAIALDLRVALAFFCSGCVWGSGSCLERERGSHASHLLLGPIAVNSPLALVILAGGLYLPLNTGLVSAVIGLVDGEPLAQVGGICYRYVFPSFMGGIVFAGLLSGTFSRPAAWRSALVLLPVIVLGYLYLLSRTAAVALVPIRSAHLEDEELDEVGSGLP